MDSLQIKPDELSTIQYEPVDLIFYIIQRDMLSYSPFSFFLKGIKDNQHIQKRETPTKQCNILKTAGNLY